MDRNAYSFLIYGWRKFTYSKMIVYGEKNKTKASDCQYDFAVNGKGHNYLSAVHNANSTFVF